MFYVTQTTRDNLYILDCSEDYEEAQRICQELSNSRPSRKYEVIEEKVFL